MDERIAGIQRGYQEQINARDETIRELKIGSMSDEDRAQLEADERAQREAELVTENWLLRKQSEDAELAEIFGKMLKAEDPDDQWKLMAEFKTALKGAGTPEPEASVPDVDPNRPAPKLPGATTGHLPDGTPITDDIAIQALKALGDRPTAEIRGR